MAIASLALYATEAAASLPSIVICRLFAMSPPSVGRHFDESQQYACVLGNDEFFVGWNHPDRHAAPGPGDFTAPRFVGRSIQLDAEPRRRLADPAPDFGRVFADAGREHDGIDPLQYRGQRAN